MIRRYPMVRGLVVFSLFLAYWTTLHPRFTGVPSSLMQGVAIGLFLGVLATMMARRIGKGSLAIAPGTMRTVGIAGFSFFAGWFSNFKDELSGLDHVFAAVLLLLPLGLYVSGLRSEVRESSVSN